MATQCKSSHATWRPESVSFFSIAMCCLKLNVSFPLFRSNVLVDSYFNAKVGDFSFTQEMPCINPDSGVTMKTVKCVVKSLGYTAPKIDACRHSVKTLIIMEWYVPVI